MFRKEVLVEEPPGDQLRVLEAMPVATASRSPVVEGELADLPPCELDRLGVPWAGLVVVTLVLGSALVTILVTSLVLYHWCR